jgi:hypothetical protein
LRPVLVVLAIIFLIEAWLWDRLEPVVAWVVARIPLARFKRWLSAAISGLPPSLTLLVFLIPPIALFPLKLLALWLIARGALASAAGVFLLGKLAGVGITAFVFDATRDKLLMMPWFRYVYDHVMAWRDWAHALVDPIKRRIKLRMRLLLPAQSRRAFGLWKRIRRIRRRMHLPPDEPLRETP